jgi:hypothetical protein
VVEELLETPARFVLNKPLDKTAPSIQKLVVTMQYLLVSS